MLVLTRKQQEAVVIQLDHSIVRVRVLDAGNGRVRLGIDAPRDIAVHREEVWNCIQQWNEAEQSAKCTNPTRYQPDAQARKQNGGPR